MPAHSMRGVRKWSCSLRPLKTDNSHNVGLDPRLRGDDAPAKATARCAAAPMRHFTPCINFWISGAIRNRMTPPISRIQKPCV